MTIFLFTLLLICLSFAGLAVGVLAGRKPLKGSCGGLNAAGVAGGCELCGGDQSRCDERKV